MAQGHRGQRHGLRRHSPCSDRLMLVQSVPYPSRPLGALTDYFANVGATRNFYGLATYPAAIHDSEGITRAFFEAWSGSRRVIRCQSYDHNTGLFGQTRGLMVGTLTDDEHGVPAACEDHEGYIHVFGNAHNTPINHLTSDDPI